MDSTDRTRLSTERRRELYLERALGSAISRVSATAEGERNATLNREAFSLGGLVAGGELSVDDTERALVDAAASAGMDESAARATCRSAFRTAEPRRVPLGGAHNADTPPRREPDKAYPPTDAVAAAWLAATRLTATEGDEHYQRALSYLERRRLSPLEVGLVDSARVLPASWCAPWWPRGWSETWALMVPAFDAQGGLRSMCARAIVSVPEDKPKVRWPYHCRARGLLLACPRGRAVLRQQPMVSLDGMLVVEGLPDTVAASVWVAKQECKGRVLAVLGVVAGSGEALKLVSWPAVPVYIATDDDEAGERYAREVGSSLPAGADVRRFKVSHAQA